MGLVTAPRTSIWQSTAERRAFAPLDGDTTADVVVVGGGITGLTTALLLARTGASVCLLERREIGAGATGNTTAKVTVLHGLVYADLVHDLGQERSQMYADANREGVRLVGELAAGLAPDASPTAAAACTYVVGPDQRPRIEAEVQATQSLGMATTFEQEIELPFPIAGAVRLDGQLHLHPLRYLEGLAGELVRLGGRVHEHTAALDITEEGTSPARVRVTTAGGVVECDDVVVATLLPFVDRGGFFAKAEVSRSYALAARIDGPPITGMYLSADQPTRSARPILLEGSPGVVVAGPSHRTGTEDDTEAFHRELEAWTAETFPGAVPVARWSAQDYRSPDRVPYVGRSPRTSRVFVATAFNKWGLSNGTAAAVMLTDLITGAENPWFPAFDATRIGGVTEVARLVAPNVETVKHVVGDRVGRLRAPDLETLGRDEGAVVRVEGSAVGAYRDPEGEVVAVDLSCTHLGCTVQWNTSERSWDCPCHGSRFAVDGSVLEGPAVRPLAPVDLPVRRPEA